MASQDSPGHGRVSPINISAPASVRGFVPLTARSTAAGLVSQSPSDENLDTFVNRGSERPAATQPSPRPDGQLPEAATLDDGDVPPPPSISHPTSGDEQHTPPQGGLPRQDHADPAPPQANPLANALAQVADTLTTVTTGIAALSSENSHRKPYLEGSIDVESTFDDKKNDFNQWTKDIFEHLGTLRKGVYHGQLIGDMVWAHQRTENDRKNWVFRDKQLYIYLKNSLKNTSVYERICDLEPTSVVDMDAEQVQWVSTGSGDLPTILRSGVAGLALEIATEKYGRFTVHDNMVTENMIQALSSTGMDLLEYISHARSLARRVRRSEGAISGSMLPTRFMAGFEGDPRFEHAYLETAKEIETKRRAGSAITFEYAAGRMEYWHVDVLHPKLALKPVHINGQLVDPSVSGGNTRGKRTGQSDEVAGVN